jgi:hypothetical protein
MFSLASDGINALGIQPLYFDFDGFQIESLS